jgi:hypothetical protein
MAAFDGQVRPGAETCCRSTKTAMASGVQSAGVLNRPRSIGLRGVLTAAVVAIAGCASVPRFSIAPRLPALAAADPAVLTLEKAHLVCVRLLTPSIENTNAEFPAFDVSVTNRGAAPLTFSAANVTVFSGPNPVRVYSAAELMDRIQNESERSADEAAAENTARLLTASATRQDPTATPLMVTRTQSLNDASGARSAAARKVAELANTIISVSIFPGGTGSGVVKLHAEDIVPAEPLRLVVTIDHEPYEFVFDVNPAK